MFFQFYLLQGEHLHDTHEQLRFEREAGHLAVQERDEFRGQMDQLETAVSAPC